MSVEQLPLFPGEPSPEQSKCGLNSESSLRASIDQFQKHMQRQDFSQYTIKSFRGDLGILERYLKTDPPIEQIGTKTLQEFLHWLQHERGKPCNAKSYARRLTTLKVFFAWLANEGVLASDPAAPLVHKPVQTPLPRILYDEQVNQMLATTQGMLTADEPDPRPHLLVTLLLHTGIKKQECMAIRLAHLDLANPSGPAVQIRYEKPRMHYKERRLQLPPGWPRTLTAYREVYEPEDFLFPCTARNLEYVLHHVAQAADLPDGLSFEMLRWTCAVRDYQARMDPERLRRKLGLSQMSWKETEPKIVRLAEPPL